MDSNPDPSQDTSSRCKSAFSAEKSRPSTAIRSHCLRYASLTYCRCTQQSHCCSAKTDRFHDGLRRSMADARESRLWVDRGSSVARSLSDRCCQAALTTSSPKSVVNVTVVLPLCSTLSTKSFLCWPSSSRCLELVARVELGNVVAILVEDNDVEVHQGTEIVLIHVEWILAQHLCLWVKRVAALLPKYSPKRTGANRHGVNSNSVAATAVWLKR